MKKTRGFVTAFEALLCRAREIARTSNAKTHRCLFAGDRFWKRMSATFETQVGRGEIHCAKRESVRFASTPSYPDLAPSTRNRWPLLILTCLILIVLGACGESEKSKVQIGASAKQITNGQPGDASDNDLADRKRGSADDFEDVAGLSQIFESFQRSVAEVSKEPVTADFLLKVERDLKDFDSNSAAPEGKIQIPPLVLSADITEIPLRRVMTVLGRRIGAKIFIAQDLPGDKISVQFSRLPVEQGIERILKGRNHVLIRRQIPGVETAVVEIRILSKDSDNYVELKELGTAEELAEEMAALTKKALEAIKAEDRLAALNELVEITNQENEFQLTDVLVSALKDKDADIRSFAVGAIGSVDDPPAEPVIEMALADEDPELRIGALEELIAVHGDAVARPILEEALADPDVRVQATAEEYFRVTRTDEFDEE